MDEAKTRRQIIDERLRLAGWNLSDRSQVTEELDLDLTRGKEPQPSYAGHQFVDYGLLDNGKPLAVVEAKKTSKDARVGQEQALQYAQNIQQLNGGLLPLVVYTNGYDIFYWESDFYPPAKVCGFPSRDDLQWLTQRKEARQPLSIELINTNIVEREYQIAAIRSILEGIEQKKSKFLLVMATGTGKTRVAVGLADVLMRAKWAKRVLFLVDRIALRDQALEAFEEHIPAQPRWPTKGERGEFMKNRRIYVATYPTMLNLIERGAGPATWLSPFFFDLVIADESHRSIYNIYQQVLTYFHAIRIGLTATPTDRIEHNTFKLFDCPVYHPTYAYTFEEAISHVPPYLCDYEVLNVRSKFQIEGIKGEALPPEVQEQLALQGIDIEDIDFEGTDLEKKVTNSGTNALIVREFMEECIKDSSGTLPGKSIFFAVSKAHARRLCDIFDILYPEHKGKLARVLVSEDPRVYGKGGLLDQFKHKNMPRVAISVDMLDTGVDVHEIVNLVFAKPVYSDVKFWQMIGRGTRVLDSDISKRKPWCPKKDKFLIIDCWANFERFKMNPRGREPGAEESLPVSLFRKRLAKLEAAMQARRGELVQATITELRADLASLPSNNVIVIENRSLLAEVEADEFWENLRPAQIKALLKMLRINIAPILRARSNADFAALSFESQIVDFQTATLLGKHESVKVIQESIIEKISELPLTVNLVAKEKTLIQEVKHPEWWAKANFDELSSLVQRIGPLMRFRKVRRDSMMALDLDDLLKVKEWIEFGPEHQRLSTSKYREKVEEHILALVAENLVLQKLQAGESVTNAEIRSLADILESQALHVTEEILRKVYHHRTARFVQLIRHILGQEQLVSWPETVTKAFDDFIAQHNTFSSLQIQFLQTLKTFILQTGRVERQSLVEAPFTRLHPQGVRGVFPANEIEEIIDFAEKLVA